MSNATSQIVSGIATRLKEQRRFQAEPSPNYAALDDGGTWYQCPDCKTFKRFGLPDGDEPFTNWCHTCSEMQTHIPNKPSYSE